MAKATPPEERHAVLGASSAYRWTACPGSPRESEGIPRQDNAYSMEGTLAHNLAACRLRNGRWVKGRDGEIPEGMEQHVRVYTKYIGDVAAGRPIWVEQEVTLAEGMFGTADCLIWYEDVALLEVVDLKYGAGVLVEVEDNPQLLYYALAAYRTFRAKGINPKRIRITIVQPRAEHHEGPIRSRDVDVFDLIEWGAWLDEKAQATKDPNAPLVAGDHCKFCPAKATCAEFRGQALAVAQVEFDDETFTPPAVAGMTLEQMGQVLEKAPILTEWLKAIQERVYESLQRGEPVPGWKLVPKRAMRKWRDEREANLVIREQLGLKWSEFMDQKIKSPAQVEKLLPPEKRAELEKLYSKESSGETLAPEHDKREGVIKLSAVDEFNT